MRKLASIQRIREILPIEGADRIELVKINNWQVVVTKEANHKVGDLVVYCEIDSFLPIRPEFEFLRKSSFKRMGEQEGFKLKTIRLKQTISQGLVISLNDVQLDSKEFLQEGDEVTEQLGIVKYEPPIPAELAGKAKGLFPSFLIKTDEIRVQNLTKEYPNWLNSDIKFYVAEKLDGSSSTFYLKDGVFGVCSRNLELVETEENTFWKVARQLDLENKLLSLGKNISIQGELIGEGVQGNPYGIKGHTVRFFNAFDIDNYQFLSLEEFTSIMNRLELETVPMLDMDFKLPSNIDELLVMADGFSILNPKTIREGLVIRSHDRTISFKAISNNFLMNEK
jgi:RNA ligase (TIGR02306 family)